MTKPFVVIESPYAGDVARNTRYARACLLDSLKRGEAPFAGHLLYTQVLDDTVPEQRELGLQAHLALLERATRVVVYGDLGLSAGMKAALGTVVCCPRESRPEVQYRRLWPAVTVPTETVGDAFLHNMWPTQRFLSNEELDRLLTEAGV